MELRERILDLIYRLETIPVGHDSLLKEYLTELRTTIEQTFTNESPYLNYLQFIKFKPDTVFVTDREREQSWQNGTTQVDNLLRVLLNDPKVNPHRTSRTPAKEDPVGKSLEALNQSIIENQQKMLEDSVKGAQTDYVIAQEDVAGDVFPPQGMEEALEKSVEKSLGNLEQSIVNEHPEFKDQPVSHPPSEKIEASEALEQPVKREAIVGLQKVLCVTSHDDHLNEEVFSFLNFLQIEAVHIPKPTAQETLMDRINQCLTADFVVFILSADFHIYARSQRPVDSSLTSSPAAAFQLGYLAAKFDRRHIVVLYREETEFLMPTEFFDLFYIPVTPAGNWKEDVLRRMKGKQELSESLGLSTDSGLGLV